MGLRLGDGNQWDTQARYRGGVHASVRTVCFILEAPCPGGLTGACPHLGSSRLLSTGLAKALDLGNLELLRYDFAMLRDYRIVIPVSCTHGELHPGSATPRQLPRSSICCVPSITAHVLHVKLLRYDFAML